MSDTTSTPKEPGGRGSIATGASSGQASKKPAVAAGDGPPVVPPGPDAGRPVAPAPGARSPGAAASGPSSEEPTKVDTPFSVDKADTGKVAAVRVPVTPTPDPPTVTHRVPGPGGNGSNGSPRPAPGPVPGPGPGSATPPPWNRIPGQEPPSPSSGDGVSHPVSDLFTDGPTTFLEAPTPPGGMPADPAEERGDPVSNSWRSARPRPPRQAALQLKRLDPWSVLKLALVLAVVLFLIFLVAVGVLYGVLDGMGVWDRLNGTYADLVASTSPGASPLISVWSVFSLAAVVGAINSLLFAVAVTISAFVYNVSADLVGGVEVTLSERD